MLPFGPITPAEQTTWQRRALGVLDGYLDVAFHDQLPPIRWTIGDAGSTLIGHCRHREEWATWQALLQLPDVRPETVGNDHARRRASGRVAGAGGLTTHVILIADVDLVLEAHLDLEARRCDDEPQDVA